MTKATVVSFGLAAMVAGGLCGCKKKMASAAQVKELHAAARKMDKKFKTDLARWRTDLLKLSGGVLPVSEAPCDSAALKKIGFGHHVVRSSDHQKIATLVPQIYLGKQRRINRYLKLSQSNTAAAGVPHLLKQMRQKPVFKFQATLVITKEHKPKMQTNGTFLPGFVQGRYLVWSAVSGSFICGADVNVQTGKTMRVFGRTSKQRRLDKSLESKATSEGKRKLRALPGRSTPAPGRRLYPTRSPGPGHRRYLPNSRHQAEQPLGPAPPRPPAPARQPRRPMDPRDPAPRFGLAPRPDPARRSLPGLLSRWTQSPRLHSVASDGFGADHHIVEPDSIAVAVGLGAGDVPDPLPSSLRFPASMLAQLTILSALAQGTGLWLASMG
jgi:hypothetical protein